MRGEYFIYGAAVSIGIAIVIWLAWVVCARILRHRRERHKPPADIPPPLKKAVDDVLSGYGKDRQVWGDEESAEHLKKFNKEVAEKIENDDVQILEMTQKEFDKLNKSAQLSKYVLTKPLGLPSNFDVVPVYFGTDRLVDAARPLNFTSNRSHALLLGKAIVTIPKDNHRIGYVEIPWSFTIAGITLYRQRISSRWHFTIQGTILLQEDAFQSCLMSDALSAKQRKGEAFIFIHGFNVCFEAALFRAAQLAYDTNFDGVVCVYSWPSGGEVRDYVYDLNSIEVAAKHLKQFLELVLSVPTIQKVHVIAHSMGSKALQLALSMASQRPTRKIAELVLASPDMDKDVFIAKAEALQEAASGRTIYVTRGDKALSAASFVAGGIARVGAGFDNGKPIIMQGFDTIDASALGADFFGLNHSTYVDNPLILNDIGALMSTGIRPPHLRTSILRQNETPEGTYWAFPG
jgi:esterase/lipase superfamily enzyme